MAVTSKVVDSERETDVVFDAGNGSPQELISYLKFSFRDSDFAKVESILTAREAKLRLEIETTQLANEWLSKRLEPEDREKYGVQEKSLELQKLNFELTQEKNMVYEKLRKAETEAESWKNKYLELESRISNLEADSKLLLNVDCSELNVRVSGENTKDVKLEREANVDRDCNGGQEPPSRRVVEIIDSDDDCATGKSCGKIEMILNSVHSGQTGVQSGTGKLKRKLDACLSVHENKIDNNFDDVEANNSATADCNKEKHQKLTHGHHGSGQTGLQSETGMLKSKLNACLNVSKNKMDNNVDDVELNNSATADCKTENFQMLTHEHVGSPVRHCSSTAIPPSSNNVEKFCTPSSQGPVILGQCEQKMEQEHTSQNLKREFLSGFHTVYDIEDSSSSSSSDSDDDWDFGFDFSQLIGTRNDKNWKSEADMLAAFVKDNKLYLQAVCALYRQQTSLGKAPLNSSSTNSQGFSHSNALRGTALAEFLIDGDLQGRLKKSIPELQQYDKNGLDDCKKLAIEHSKQLFEIYQRKEDPLFFS